MGTPDIEVPAQVGPTVDPDQVGPGNEGEGRVPRRQRRGSRADRAVPRRRRRRRRGLAIGAIVVGVGVWWVGWHSPVTIVDHIVVSVPKGISEQAVRSASGITAVDHVPAVNPAEVRVAIMTELASVADVAVRRTLPDTIELEVTARSPFAAVAAPGSGYYVVDAQGVAFDTVDRARGLPAIRATGDLGRDTALAILVGMPDELRAQVRRVSAQTRDDAVLTLRDGGTVRWGGASDAGLKAKVLADLLPVHADEYDVGAPLQPTTRGPEPE